MPMLGREGAMLAFASHGKSLRYQAVSMDSYERIGNGGERVLEGIGAGGSEGIGKRGEAEISGQWNGIVVKLPMIGFVLRVLGQGRTGLIWRIERCFS